MEVIIALAGVATVVIALRNWRQWQQDRMFIHKPGNEPVHLNELPHVSVLVAAWNEAALIREHIRSFLDLSYAPRELILCAGGNDGTYAICQEYASSQVTIVEQQPGEGKQRALQRCLQAASGELIYLTDADCLLNDHAFTQMLALIVNEGETVVTGSYQPRLAQRTRSFVLQRWFSEVYVQAHNNRYVDGLLGGNALLTRTALEAVGAFADEALTGTDYQLAKKLLAKCYRVCYSAASDVETFYPETISAYAQQQSRWLRNVVIYGTRFKAYNEVLRGLLPSFIGLVMLLTPLIALVLGYVPLLPWLLLWWQMLLNRLRYMRFGELQTGSALGIAGYLALPFYMILDFGVWSLPLLQYPLKQSRVKW